jgi:hypothetical protein
VILRAQTSHAARELERACAICEMCTVYMTSLAPHRVDAHEARTRRTLSWQRARPVRAKAELHALVICSWLEPEEARICAVGRARAVQMRIGFQRV